MTALAACRAAYDAWRHTQPQLFWTDENLYGLDETEACRSLRLVEPAGLAAGNGTGPSDRATGGRGEDRFPAASPSGLNTGAEPRCATPWAFTALRAAPPAPPNAGGSAPYQHDGPDASSVLGARRGQIGV